MKADGRDNHSMRCAATRQDTYCDAVVAKKLAVAHDV